MIYRLTISILITFFMGACCGSKNTTSNLNESQKKNDSFKKIAVEKFDNNYQFKFNSDSTYLICYSQNKKSQDVFPPLKYFIYDLNNNDIVFEESLPNGKIKWINDFQVQVYIVPGIVHGDENKNSSSVYIYDVKHKRKIKSNQYEINK